MLEEDPTLLFGQVLADENKRLAKRFGFSQHDLPAALLFRDRKVLPVQDLQQLPNLAQVEVSAPVRWQGHC